MISALVESVFLEAAQVLKPPPKLTISQWADRHFYLSSEDSAEPGKYHTSRTPFVREMLDVTQEPHVEEVVYMLSAQTAKTTAMKILLAHCIAEDPGPVCYLMPTLDMGRRWSKQRLAPMLRDVPKLRGMVETGERKIGNSILEKSFPGGLLIIVGANSPSALSSYPIKYVLADEEDRYSLSAGKEGDPVSLAKKRTTTYQAFARVVHASTPTLKGLSRIEAMYDISDGRQWHVPCPHCGEFQVLRWSVKEDGRFITRLIWPKDEPPTPQNVYYPCEHCGAALTEADKPGMLARGKWIAQRPHIRNIAGFWMNELCSPFVKWSEMVKEFQEAKAHRENKEKLKVFVNTALAETWYEDLESASGDELMKRREEYPPPALPDGVTVLTASVDVQADRLELEVWGWGKGEEAWGVDRLVFEGDTAKHQGWRDGDGNLRPNPWEALDDFLLNARYLHARGVRLDIAAVFVDAGYLTAEVMKWTKQRSDRRITSVRGFAGFSRPPLARATTSNRQRIKMYPVGVDVIKELLYRRLKIQTPGAGYVHFSRYKHDAEYFGQLTCEKLVPGPNRGGFPSRRWEKPAGARNEALDLWVYAYAAFLSLSQEPGRMLEKLRAQLLERAKFAAAARRERADPNQLALLASEPEAARTSAREEGVGSRESGVSEEQRPSTVDRGPSADFADQEYKIAERLDGDAPAPEPPKAPVIKVRKSKWV